VLLHASQQHYTVFVFRLGDNKKHSCKCLFLEHDALVHSAMIWHGATLFDVEGSKPESVFYSLVCHSFSIQKVFRCPDLLIHTHSAIQSEHSTYRITSHPSSKSACGKSYFYIQIFNNF